MPIDTEIKGNVESIRSAANWVGDSLASGITDAVSQIYAARNSADAGWRGEAAEAFRAKVTAGARKGDTFAKDAKSMAQSFDDVAADLQGAQRELERIRGDAASAGLRVDGHAIQDPGPAPPDAGAAPTGEAATPAAMAAHGEAVQAQNAHAEKVKAYKKAQADAEDVRRKWQGSVEAVNKKSNAAAAQGWFSVGDAALRHVGAMHDGYTGVVTDRKGMYRNLDRANASTRAASAAADDAAKAQRAGKSFGLKAGGALAVAGVAYEISQGKDPVQAIVSGAAGFGASVAAGAIVGSAIPVPVVGTVAGAIVGAGVGVFTSGMVDSLWENGIGEVGGAIEDGAQAVADAGEAVGGAIADAGSAVAGGVKDAWDAWDAIF